MTTATAEQVDSFVRSDILGVMHLARYWHRHTSALEGRLVAAERGDLTWDRILLDGLGVSIEEAQDHLSGLPGLEEFERWIIARSEAHAAAVERINCVVSGEEYPKHVRNAIREIEDAEPVLSAEDLAFWDENGYVIVSDAVSLEQALEAETAVWQHLGMDPRDAGTWYENPIGKGIMTGLYNHPALAANRTAARIRKAFSQLWKTGDLWTSVDRAGFNPPENERFKFPGPHIHWDMNLTRPLEFGTLGILYLCDTAAEQGAFTCIPGFHKRIDEWLDELPVGADPRQEILKEPTTRIAANAGDLIIWDQRLPHGGSPNTFVYPRIVQYLNMYPAVIEEGKPWL